MTIKYELTKSYHRHERIKITISSFLDYVEGNRTSLEHIVTYHNQEKLVVSKPPYKGYKYYTPIRRNSLPSLVMSPQTY